MSAPKGKVLVVDDEVAIVHNLTALLKLEGYEVMGTISGSDALNLLTSYYPDVLVTDLTMPDVTGLDLIQHCAAHALDTAVIIMTGYWSLESAVSALQFGAYDYVLKPCEPPLLLAAVTRAAERHYLLRELTLRKQHDAMMQMAMTVSHELNNPLAVVLGLVQLHLDDAPDNHALPESLQADLRAIEAHIHRISDALRRLTSIQERVSAETARNDGYGMFTTHWEVDKGTKNDELT